MALEREYATYLREKARLLAEGNAGKHALIFEDEIDSIMVLLPRRARHGVQAVLAEAVHGPPNIGGRAGALRLGMPHATHQNRPTAPHRWSGHRSRYPDLCGGGVPSPTGRPTDPGSQDGAGTDRHRSVAGLR